MIYYYIFIKHRKFINCLFQKYHFGLIFWWFFFRTLSSNELDSIRFGLDRFQMEFNNAMENLIRKWPNSLGKHYHHDYLKIKFL